MNGSCAAVFAEALLRIHTTILHFLVFLPRNPCGHPHKSFNAKRVPARVEPFQGSLDEAGFAFPGWLRDPGLRYGILSGFLWCFAIRSRTRPPISGALGVFVILSGFLSVRPFFIPAGRLANW
jgi:hypothetical protein